ncbi:hypothetical protein [Burkholderia pseudomallei]|uniref:hypothetical protein n=1 Tax=Burkholderia pseudomallei TaxID=28450 RepID=UPI000977DE4F|nr:hypothetical protein [Burkholderia pseudomallei]OMT35726.1 hypothetical protein AQ756_01245 [Burkholderia pseudomallei]
MMNKINLKPVSDDLPDKSNSTANAMPRVMWTIALAAALFASVISLGINVYAGMLRAGTVTEQVWTVATSLVAVLCMYLAPMLWRFAPTRARAVLAVLWLLAICSVLRGQVDVLAFANVHAADERAKTVAVVAVPTVEAGIAGRSLVAIEQGIAKARIDLARVDARRCVGECRSWRLRRVELSAQLAVLNAEADEAKRRATEQEWRRDEISRAQALRESRRAAPGTALVAPWLGTTEARLDLLMNFVLVVVLEGTACYCWYVVGCGAVATRRTAVADDRSATTLESLPVVPTLEPPQDGRNGEDATQAALVEPQPVASHRNLTAMQREAVASIPETAPTGRVEPQAMHAAILSMSAAVATDADATAMVAATGGVTSPHDEAVLEQIHHAVVAGRLPRNLASIRTFLGCRQSRAIHLNRLYIARFGRTRNPMTRA